MKRAVLLGLIVLFSMVAGWSGNEIYESRSVNRIYDGLHIEDQTYLKVKKTVNSYDPNGDWVCVNVRGMKWNRAIEVIQHEVGHEIFAEKCEKNITKCMDVVGK